MRFSQRIGARPPFSSGLEEASPKLRTALWNVLQGRLFPGSYNDLDAEDVSYRNAQLIWVHMHRPVNEAPTTSQQAKYALSEYWLSCEWPEFFDLFEFSLQCVMPEEDDDARAQWFSEANDLLEDQGCAYRFISEELAPLTNPLEVQEVSRAADSAIESVAEHIRAALALMPPNPDHSARNSIKESISAVEAALKNLTGDATATLGEGLKLFAKKYQLDQSLYRVIEQIYAFTNAPSGMRHAKAKEAPDVTIDQARLMVVVCSAFSNHLIALTASAPAA